jgi:uncharacterized protein (TIGR00369 family)
VTTEPASNDLVEIRRREHRNCIVCGANNDRGFGLDFKLADDGSVEATFTCDRVFEGYTDFVHGGVISSLLDGAMTNCMFAHGFVAVTAELNIRFRHPVTVGKPATVRAWIEKTYRPLHVVQAEVFQDDETKATATGKFMECDPSPHGKGSANTSDG